jgi:hypothetical protein
MQALQSSPRLRPAGTPTVRPERVEGFKYFRMPISFEEKYLITNLPFPPYSNT